MIWPKILGKLNGALSGGDPNPGAQPEYDIAVNGTLDMFLIDLSLDRMFKWFLWRRVISHRNQYVSRLKPQKWCIFRHHVLHQILHQNIYLK